MVIQSMSRTTTHQRGYEKFPGYDYETYIDSGISGKNIEGRPAMKRLLQDVKDNKIEMVLSWKLNRISRSMRDVFNIIHEFKEHGVGYKSISENIDTSNASGSTRYNVWVNRINRTFHTDQCQDVDEC